MKKEDQFPLNRQQIIEEKFRNTEYDKWLNADPLTAKKAIANELNYIKSQQHERIETAKKNSEEAQRAEIEETRRKLKEAEYQLATLQNNPTRTHETRTHDGQK